MIGLGVLLLGTVCSFAAGKLTRDFANPVSVYTLAWTLTVSLFFAGWVSYTPVQPQLWWAVLLSASGFGIGGWSALLWGHANTNKPSQYQPFGLHSQRFKGLLLVFTVLGGLGLVLQIHHLQNTMGLDLLLSDPVSARRLHSNVPLWGYLNLLNVANIPLCLVYKNHTGKYRLWMILTIVFAVVAALLTTDRTRFFYMVLWTFFIWLYSPNRQLPLFKKWLGFGFVGALLLVFFIGIGEHYDRKYRDRFPEHIHLPQSLEVLVEPYIYLTGSLAALDSLLADENPMHKGKFSFSPIVSLMRIFMPDLETVTLQGKLYFVPMEVNTYSYLQQFFQDFGWWGILLGPYVCGWISAWAYCLMRKKPTFLRIYLSSLLSFCCLMSVFVNTFTQEATWFFVFVGFAVHWWVLPTKPIKPEPVNHV